MWEVLFISFPALFPKNSVVKCNTSRRARRRPPPAGRTESDYGQCPPVSRPDIGGRRRRGCRRSDTDGRTPRSDRGAIPFVSCVYHERHAVADADACSEAFTTVYDRRAVKASLEPLPRNRNSVGAPATERLSLPFLTILPTLPCYIRACRCISVYRPVAGVTSCICAHSY